MLGNYHRIQSKIVPTDMTEGVFYHGFHCTGVKDASNHVMVSGHKGCILTLYHVPQDNESYIPHFDPYVLSELYHDLVTLRQIIEKALSSSIRLRYY